MALRSLGVCCTVAAAAACGSNGTNHLADSGADAPRQVDAAPDAPPDAPAPGPVTIVVVDDGAPGSNATVYFQNADSSLVAEATTGSDGTATEVMAPGGFVTLIEPAGPKVVGLDPENQGVDTFAGVQPGDVLHITLGAAAATTLSFTLTFPDDGEQATNYELITPCGNVALGDGAVEVVPLVTSKATVTLDNCKSPVDMLITNTDGSGAPLDSLFAAAVAIGSGSNAQVSVTGTYQPIGTQTFTDTGIPAPGVTELQATHLLVDASGVFAQAAPVVDYVDGSASAVVVAGQPVLTGATVVSVVEQTFSGNGTTLLDDQTFDDWGPEATTAVAVDGSGERLPDYTAAPVFDVTAQQVTWSVTGGGSATVDVVYGFLGIDRAEGSGSGSAASPPGSWNWVILAPPAQVGAIQLPTLPTDLFAWNPVATDTVSIESVEMGEAPGGYDAVRGNGISEDFDAELDTSTPSGHVVLDYFQAAAPVEVVAAPSHRRRGHARAWRSRR